MAFLLVFLTLLAICLAAPFLGRDSRDLHDEHNEVGWDRLPS